MIQITGFLKIFFPNDNTQVLTIIRGVISFVVPIITAYFTAVVTTHYKYKKEPMRDLNNHCPQIEYNNIQSDIDLKNIIEANSDKTCYKCELNIVKDDNGQKTTRIIINKIDLKKEIFSKKLASYLICNNSDMNIKIDSVLDSNGTPVPMNGFTQFSIAKGNQLLLLFTIDLELKEIIIDYSNYFYHFSVTGRPQYLKVTNRTYKK